MGNPWIDKIFRSKDKTDKQALADELGLLVEEIDLKISSILGSNGIVVTKDGNIVTISIEQGLAAGDSPEFRKVGLSSLRQGSILFMSPDGAKRYIAADWDNLRWEKRPGAMYVKDIFYPRFQTRQTMAAFGMGIFEDYGKYPWTTNFQLGSENTCRSLCYLGHGRVLAGTSTSGRIYISDDHGKSFKNMGTIIAGETHIYAIAYCGNGIVLAGTRPLGKIGRSTNWGDTWTDIGQLAAETYVMSLVYLGGGIALAGTNPLGKIFRSIDYGETWSSLGQMFSETQVCSLAYCGNGIALAGTYNVGKILRSTDYGLTWVDVSQENQFTQVFSLCYGEAGIVLAGTSPGGKILRSEDFGLTWKDLGQQASETEILTISYLGSGTFIAGTAQNAKILVSKDWGKTWTNLGQRGNEGNIRSSCYLGDGVALIGTGEAHAHIWRHDSMRTAGIGVTYNFDSLSLTIDGDWHTVQNYGAKSLKIAYAWSSADPAHACDFRVRKLGSTAALGDMQAAFYAMASGFLEVDCDQDGYWQYNFHWDGGSGSFSQIGYFG